jgi:peptidyl-prolyl cis-trans isomerase SurA
MQNCNGHKSLRFLLMLVLLAAAGLKSQPLHVDGIMAIVGDKVVLRSDYETEMGQLARSGNFKDSQQFSCLVLRKLILRKLMLNQAEIDSLPLSEERIDAEIDNRLRYFQRQAGSQADLERYLGKTLSEYREDIRPKMKEQLLAQEMEGKITSSVKISPQEVKQFYDNIQNDSLPIIPAEVEVAQLLIEPPVSPEAKEFAREQLQMLRMRVLSGESFEKLAKTYSQDPGSKDNNGLLPEFGRGEMVPEFERMAFKLKPDSISPVFESPFGFHLMKVSKRLGERVLASHILIRAEYTTADFTATQKRIDSAYDLLYEKKTDWCTAVKRYASADIGNKGYCGFFTDETTGSQKMIFDDLPPEIKMIVDKLKPGEFSEPARTFTPDGRAIYRMVYLKSFTAPHQANLSQDYGRIQLEAEARKKQKAIDNWVNKTKKDTYIRVQSNLIQCPDLKSLEAQN